MPRRSASHGRRCVFAGARFPATSLSWPLPEAMTDEALEPALSLFAHASIKQAVVVRSREHHLGRPDGARHGNIATEIAMQIVATTNRLNRPLTAKTGVRVP